MFPAMVPHELPPQSTNQLYLDHLSKVVNAAKDHQLNIWVETVEIVKLKNDQNFARQPIHAYAAWGRSYMNQILIL